MSSIIHITDIDADIYEYLYIPTYIFFVFQSKTGPKAFDKLPPLTDSETTFLACLDVNSRNAKFFTRNKWSHPFYVLLRVTHSM